MNSPIPRTVVGVDVSTGNLRIAMLHSSLGRLKLTGTFKLEQFESMDLSEQTTALSKAAAQYPLKGARIFLSLPQESAVVRQITFPVQAAADLRAAVELQIESLSPWPVVDVYWDLGRGRRVRGETKLHVTVALVARATVDRWVELFAAAGISLAGVSVPTVAWGQAVARLWGSSMPTLVLDLQPGHVAGALIRNGRIVSTCLSGEESSKDLAHRAAAHLASVGRVGSSDEIRVLICGSAADGLDADNPLLPIEGATRESVDSFRAIAAALGGLEPSSSALNLVPEAQRFRSNHARLVPTYVGIVLALVAASALILREPYQWAIYAAELDAAIAAVASDAVDAANPAPELDALSERYRVLGLHLNGRDRTLEVLDDLVRVMPPDTWLTRLALNGESVTISGFSNSAANIQRLVEESELFESAEFTASVVRDDAGRDRFTLQFDIGRPL